MEHFCIDIERGFHCMGGDCPYTCCQGWQILVDDETYARYKVQKGIRGKHLRNFISKKEPIRIKKLLTRCPFYLRDGRCLHQACGDELLMPLVCRNYPRRVNDFGDFTESTIELSCPAAAELFLKNLGRREFVKNPNPRRALWVMENDDKEFLEYLKAERETILKEVWSDGPLYEKWESIYPFVYQRHDFLATDSFDKAKQTSLTGDKKSQGKYAIYDERGYCFFSLKTIDRMLVYHVDYGALIIRVPKFYHFIKRYLKIFSKKTITDANRFFHEKIDGMCKEDPRLLLKYKSYFSYLIQQDYLECYEGYSMVREFLMCVLYTQLLMLMDLIEHMDKGKITPERETEILWLLEHNTRHNPILSKNLYRVLRDEFL